METRSPSAGAVLTLCVFALSCFLGGLFVWHRFGGHLPLQAQGFRFNVTFAEGGNLAPNADVRISGVEVGHVVHVRARGQRTEAEIELDPRYAPPRADTRVVYRVKTLLGEPFIALTPGTRDAPRLREGATLPVGQVDPNQQLDQVLQSFDAPARRALKQLVLELSKGLEGRDQSLGNALGGSAELADRLDRLATDLDADRPALTTLVRDAGTTLEALGDRTSALQRMVRAGDAVAGTTAARSRDVQRLVRVLPGFLARVDGASRQLDAALGDAAPSVRALRPAGRALAPALARADAVLPPATSLLRALPGTLRAASGDLRALPPVATAVARAAAPLRDTATQLLPVVQLISAYRKDLVGAIATTAAVAQGSVRQPGGDLLHYMRVVIGLTNESLVGAPKRLPTNRHDAYPAPGALGALADPKGLQAFSCANTADPPGLPVVGFGTPACRQAPPWTFRGRTRQFPDLRAGSRGRR